MIQPREPVKHPLEIFSEGLITSQFIALLSLPDCEAAQAVTLEVSTRYVSFALASFGRRFLSNRC